MSGTPEQRIADAIRELCNESRASKVWVNELYKKCGGLDFARPREFEQMLIEMFALGIICPLSGRQLRHILNSPFPPRRKHMTWRDLLAALQLEIQQHTLVLSMTSLERKAWL